MPIDEDGTLVPEPAAPPQFPQVGINIQPNGMLIQILIAPGFAFTQLIDEKTMNDVAGKWLETRREIKKEQQLVADVMRSKKKQA